MTHDSEKANWEVVVGNIGTVYAGSNGFTAHTKFQTYCGHSKSNYGRAAGESVTLFKDGEIVKEYDGTLALVDSLLSEDEQAS